MITKLKILLIFSLSLVLITACGDSLGVNDAVYTKSQLNNEIIRRDTMIDFKKVIIETIITETDTIIQYIPVVKTYEPVYSQRYDMQLIESFFNNSIKKVTERLPEIADITVTSILDYNPITPQISYKIRIDNSKSNNANSFKERNEIIDYLDIEFKNVSVINDVPLTLRELIQNYELKLYLNLINRSGKTRKLINEGVFGEVMLSNRYVFHGQLRGITLSGILQVPSREPNELQGYSIEFSVIVFFPQI